MTERVLDTFKRIINLVNDSVLDLGSYEKHSLSASIGQEALSLPDDLLSSKEKQTLREYITDGIIGKPNRENLQNKFTK